MSGQKENGLKEHGTLIIVMKIPCCLILVGSVFRSTINVVTVKYNKSCNSLSGDMQGV